MHSLARNIIAICWGLFAVVWILAALSTKRTAYRETSFQRFRYMVPIVIGWILVFRGHRFGYPLNVRIISRAHPVLIAAVILCIFGVALCVWARAILGRNWSGTVTLKEGHELVMRGPYRLVRHPIYTGFFAMLAATAIFQGHIAGIIGLILIFISLWIKLSGEEQLMLKQFPDQYAAYQQQVKRLIPFVL
jgi:protein-S-isoprenylcysteine O-methyltransferase